MVVRAVWVLTHSRGLSFQSSLSLPVVQETSVFSVDWTHAQRHTAMTWAQRLKRVFNIDIETLPWWTTPIEAESSLGPDSHHPIISLSGIPSAVLVFRILHPILASTLCAANPLARIAEPTMAL